MIKFGSNNIIVGYIKELLHSFNLPLIEVFKDDKRLASDARYIKENGIYKTKTTFPKTSVKVISLEETPITSYRYNKPVLNVTENFINTSLTYDFETHKYLGKYLRFIRDYNGLDLMSLYNYFANCYITDLDITREIENTKVIQDTTDSRYKYYLIPVVAGCDYTIAIDCSLPYFVCGLFYDKRYIKSSNNFIEDKTFQKISGSSFNKPILYSALNNTFLTRLTEDEFTNYYQNKNNLSIVLKLPASCSSSIVILEGNHCSDNDYYIEADGSFNYNYSVTNYGNNPDFKKISLKSRSQLLNINSGVSYPFADKLIGYLVENSITNMTNISQDIKRVQKKLSELQESNSSLILQKNLDLPYGVWKDEYRNILYDYYRKWSSSKNVESFDILGYVDKDVEKSLNLLKSKGKDIKI